MEIVLASGSPRRRELLHQIGLNPTVVPSRIDESEITAPTPRRLTEKLAAAKARDVVERMCREAEGKREALVLGADTVVVLDRQTLGKPAGAAVAREMLQALSGRTHEVCTGVALLQVKAGQVVNERVWSETTRVAFRHLQPEEIDAYIGTGEPMDKAGAYGIQGRGAMLVAGVYGSYSNVVGLPLGSLSQVLNELGWPPHRFW